MVVRDEFVNAPGVHDQFYLQNCWRYRHLFAFLAWKEVLLRYKQTFFGVVWLIINALITTVVFTFVFSKMAKVESAGAPYPVISYTGIIFWQFCTRVIADNAGCLVKNAGLIKKIYFPRIIIPVSSSLVYFIDLSISLFVFSLFMLIFHISIGWSVICLPLFVALGYFTALGIGLWLSAINVKFRDVNLMVPFLLQVGMFLSPVAYTSTSVPKEWLWLYSLNPLVFLIEGFRFSLVGQPIPLSPLNIATSLASTAIILTTGLHYFKKAERFFDDLV